MIQPLGMIHNGVVKSQLLLNGLLVCVTLLSGCTNSDDDQYHEIDPQEIHAVPDEDVSSVLVNPETSSLPAPVNTSEVPVPANTSTAMPDPVGTTSPPAVGTTDVPPPAITSLSVAPVVSSSSELIAAPLVPKLLIPTRSFVKEGPQQALRVTFDDIDLLKVLNMEPVPEDAVSMFPDWLRQLDGQRVLIRGFMYPTLSQTGITYFQHVRDNEICCFGRTPKIYDRIGTVLQPDHPTSYIQGRPYDVIGTLRIDPIYEDGEWLQLYLLEDAIVIP